MHYCTDYDLRTNIPTVKNRIKKTINFNRDNYKTKMTITKELLMIVKEILKS